MMVSIRRRAMSRYTRGGDDISSEGSRLLRAPRGVEARVTMIISMPTITRCFQANVNSLASGAPATLVEMEEDEGSRGAGLVLYGRKVCGGWGAMIPSPSLVFHRRSKTSRYPKDVAPLRIIISIIPFPVCTSGAGRHGDGVGWWE